MLFISLHSKPTAKIRYSLGITSDLSFQMTYADVKISPPKSLDVSQTIQFASDVGKLLSYLDGYDSKKLTVDDHVKSASDLLTYVQQLQIDEEKSQIISFIKEQLQNLFKPPTRHRFSNYTTAVCMTWYKTSPALYKLILSDKLVIIPAESTMK